MKVESSLVLTYSHRLAYNFNVSYWLNDVTDMAVEGKYAWVDQAAAHFLKQLSFGEGDCQNFSDIFPLVHPMSDNQTL
jgi:hypothetical protein